MMFLNLFKMMIKRNLYGISRIAAIPLKKKGEKISIRGWVQNIRKMKNNLFLDVNDGSSCFDVQVVVPKSLIMKNDYSVVVGDSLEIIGNMSVSPQGDKEIQAEHVNVVGKSVVNEIFPFTPKQTHPPEYVRDYLHLRSRISYMNSIFRIRHMATKFFQDYFNETGFTYIHTPIITENDCEGAGEVFIVRPDNMNLLKEMCRNGPIMDNQYQQQKQFEHGFFDKKVFLSVSGQLCLEAMSHGLGNTYTLAPTFRAENSRSSVHLSEFYMLEAELTFVSDLYELTHFIEDMIKNVTVKLLDKCNDDLKNCTKKMSLPVINYEECLLNKKWITITYDEAYKILDTHVNELMTEINWNKGFSKEQELLLVKYFNSPVFIINWPKAIKPFYMKTLQNDPLKVYAVDLLAPNVGELIGGSLRENNYEHLKNVTPKGLEWYLELRKFGSIPTGGFGMGFERYLQLITGVKNIRDVIPFPRYPHNCKM